MSSGIFNQFTGYHNRKSIRLRAYDYSQPGYYFVTICIHDRKQRLFGDVVDGKMELNEWGLIVQNEFIKTEQMRPNIKIDTCVIMPDHIHVVFGVGAYCNTPRLQKIPRQNTPFASPSGTIGAVVRGIKSTITKQINSLRNFSGTAIWQRNYYEHIIRDEKSLYFIRKYIRENPVNWFDDFENHIDQEIRKFGMSEIGDAK